MQIKTLFFSCLATTYVLADSVCGPSKRFMVALKCNDNTTQLVCGPNNLKDRTQFCTSPNIQFAEAKCKQRGGYKGLDLKNSGCYSEQSEFWLDQYNLVTSGTGFCEIFPLQLQDKIVSNLGFESGDLSGWTYSGPNGARVVCDEDAPEGKCYAELSTEQTGPLTSANKLQRSDLVLSNIGGCNGNPQSLAFFYKFAAGDYIPFNDYLSVQIKHGSGNVLSRYVLDVATVGDYGNSGWKYVIVPLGSIHTGHKLAIDIEAESKNDQDGSQNSYGYVDGFVVIDA